MHRDHDGGAPVGAMTPIPISFDVTGPVIGGPHRQAAWLFTPPETIEQVGVLLCLDGGTYDKNYWHLDVPGHAGYSLAEHAAALGWIVIALDHLGVGESDDPARVALDLPMLCEGDAA